MRSRPLTYAIHAIWQQVEWLVVPGACRRTFHAVQDYRLHVQAWQNHFAAIFGLEAVARVRGFFTVGDGAAESSRCRL